jgi:hypothetical protein
MSGSSGTRKPQNGKVEIETRPDGWERFERAVDAAVKSGPKHRAAKPQPKKKATKPPSK